LAIDLLPMANVMNDYLLLAFVHAVYHAIVANAYAVQLFGSCQLD